MRNLDYKDRIQQLAEDLAERNNKDYWSLSEQEREFYYELAYKEFTF